MKIPASPLLIASLALTSTTLAAPTAIKRETSPSPNPDIDCFDHPAPRALPGVGQKREVLDARKGNPDLAERRRSVFLKPNAQVEAGLKAQHRRAVSMGNKRQLGLQSSDVTGATANVLSTATGTVNTLATGGVLPAVGGIVGGVADTANGLIGGLPIAGPVVVGVTRPLTGGVVDGLNTGNPLGVVHGVSSGVGGAVGGLTQTVDGLLPGQLGGVVAGVTQPLVAGLKDGRPVTGVVNTVNGLVGTVGSVLPGGLGNTVTGLTAPLLGTVAGTVDGLISQQGPLGGILGQDGLVSGLLGSNGPVGGLLGGQGGLLGGVTGQDGLLGGLLGGGNGGLVEGLTGQNGLLGGLLGGGSGGANGGLLGGLLGGGGGSTAHAQTAALPPQQNFQIASAEAPAQAPSTAQLIALIQSQGGVIQNLGNNQFLTSKNTILALPAGLSGQLQQLLAAQVKTVTQNNVGINSVGDAVSQITGNAPAPVQQLLQQAQAAPQMLQATAAQVSGNLPLDKVTGRLSVDNINAVAGPVAQAIPSEASGKPSPSAEALAMAAQILQKGQTLSDADLSNLLQSLNLDPSVAMIALGDGMENQNLGPLEQLVVVDDGTARMIPIDQSTPNSVNPTGEPVSSTSSVPVPVASSASSVISSSIQTPSAIPSVKVSPASVHWAQDLETPTANAATPSISHDKNDDDYDDENLKNAEDVSQNDSHYDDGSYYEDDSTRYQGGGYEMIAGSQPEDEDESYNGYNGSMMAMVDESQNYFPSSQPEVTSAFASASSGLPASASGILSSIAGTPSGSIPSAGPTAAPGGYAMVPENSSGLA